MTRRRLEGCRPPLRIDQSTTLGIELCRRFSRRLETPERSVAPGNFLELEGLSEGTSTAIALINALASLAGTSPGFATATALINALLSLEGSAAGSSQLSATLSALVGASGLSAGLGAASGTLAGLGALSGLSTGSSTLTGLLTAALSGDLAGTTNGAATALAILQALANLEGSAAGNGTMLGAITGTGSLAGLSPGAATQLGLLSALASLQGAGAGLGALSGDIGAFASLLGSTDGTSTAGGTIDDAAGGDNTPVVGIWRHTNAQVVTTTPTKVNFDTQERNDGYTVSGDDILLPTGRFLVLYQTAWIGSGINNRGQVVGRVSLNGAVQDGSHGSGYQRDTSNDAAWAAGHAIVNATAGDALSVEIFRDANSSVGGLDANRSWLMIASIDSTQDFAYYNLASSSTLGATTYADVPLATVSEVGSSISRTGNDVSLTAGKYLICGGVFFTVGGARTSRFTRFTLDGVHVPGSSGYSYGRNTSNEFMGPNSFAIVDLASTQTLRIQARGPGPGGTPVAGSSTSDSAGLWIARLPDTARFFSSADTIAGQNVGATSVTVPFNETTIRSDAQVVSSSTTSSVTLAADMDLLVAAGAMVRRTASNGTRLTREIRVLVGGAETSPVAIASGEYNRGDQGSQDCYDSAHVVRGILSGTTGQVFSVTIDQNRDTGWGDGGGNPLTNNTEAPGFYLLDLATAQG